MKKNLYFIKWLGKNIFNEIKKFDRWMWGWVITCMLFSHWASSDFSESAKYIFFSWLVGFWGIYGIVYTGIKHSYRKFIEEQNEIIDHLKS